MCLSERDYLSGYLINTVTVCLQNCPKKDKSISVKKNCLHYIIGNVVMWSRGGLRVNRLKKEVVRVTSDSRVNDDMQPSLS